MNSSSKGKLSRSKNYEEYNNVSIYVSIFGEVIELKLFS